MTSSFSLFDGACWYVVFLASTTLHEASHAFTAYKLGDDTAYRAGQVSLDPTPHIRREPVGMVVVPLLFYFMAGYIVGWASAPYNPEWARQNPRRAGIMGVAGPLANLLLVFLAALLIHLGVAIGWFHLSSHPYGAHVALAMQDGIPHLLALLLSITFTLNLVLFCFNCLPFPPLDGSSFPLLFLSPRAAATYTAVLRHPGFALFGVLLAYNLFPSVFGPIQHLATRLLFP